MAKTFDAEWNLKSPSFTRMLPCLLSRPREMDNWANNQIRKLRHDAHQCAARFVIIDPRFSFPLQGSRCAVTDIGVSRLHAIFKPSKHVRIFLPRIRMDAKDSNFRASEVDSASLSKIRSRGRNMFLNQLADLQHQSYHLVFAGSLIARCLPQEFKSKV